MEGTGRSTVNVLYTRGFRNMGQATGQLVSQHSMSSIGGPVAKKVRGSERWAASKDPHLPFLEERGAGVEWALVAYLSWRRDAWTPWRGKLRLWWCIRGRYRDGLVVSGVLDLKGLIRLASIYRLCFAIECICRKSTARQNYYSK